MTDDSSDSRENRKKFSQPAVLGCKGRPAQAAARSQAAGEREAGTVCAMSIYKRIVPKAVRRANRVHSKIPRSWHLFNADQKIVGRVARAAAHFLQGKHKPHYNHSRDVGDHVVIVNAERVEFSGKKWKKKVYRHHTGYPGGLKEQPALWMREYHPDRILKRAIYGMLPKTRLRKKMMNRLKVVVGPVHPHSMQIEQIPKEQQVVEEWEPDWKFDIIQTDWSKAPAADDFVYGEEEHPGYDNKIRQYRTIDESELVDVK